MRVIAGSARGVTLKAPAVSGLRPTSDLIRGAMFDILGQFFEPEERVLDLYAGTGALGIEALSRGAGWADFVEEHPRCCAAIRDNLTAAGFSDQGKVFCVAASRAAPSLVGPYSLVFMDPPYALPPDRSLVRQLPLTPEATLVFEHARWVALPQDFAGLALQKQRRHGDTVISVFGKPVGPHPSPLPEGEGLTKP